LGGVAALSADVAGSWLLIQFDGGYTRTVLSAVVLLLHQQIEFVHTIKGRAVFFLVIREWFKETNKGDAALVFYLVAHGGVLRCKYRKK
jgi:hypothetical protein